MGRGFKNGREAVEIRGGGKIRKSGGEEWTEIQGVDFRRDGGAGDDGAYVLRKSGFVNMYGGSC